MENMDNINNYGTKPKRVYSAAQIKAVEAFHERHRDSEEYKIKQRANSKRAHEKDKERIIARVRANQRRTQELQQIKKLHELKEQGLITFINMNKHFWIHIMKLLKMVIYIWM